MNTDTLKKAKELCDQLEKLESDFPSVRCTHIIGQILDAVKENCGTLLYDSLFKEIRRLSIELLDARMAELKSEIEKL